MTICEWLFYWFEIRDCVLALKGFAAVTASVALICAAIEVYRM